jgi:hypothetical protein
MATSLGMWVLFVQFEPQMFAQMFVFRHTIPEVQTLFGTIGTDLLREPILLLGAAALSRRRAALVASLVAAHRLPSDLGGSLRRTGSPRWR